MIEILLICEYIQAVLICYVHLDFNLTKNILHSQSDAFHFILCELADLGKQIQFIFVHFYPFLMCEEGEMSLYNKYSYEGRIPKTYAFDPS